MPHGHAPTVDQKRDRLVPHLAYTYRRAITLVQVLSQPTPQAGVLALCEAWGVAPAGAPDAIDFTATIHALADHALERARGEIEAYENIRSVDDDIAEAQRFLEQGHPNTAIGILTASMNSINRAAEEYPVYKSHAYAAIEALTAATMGLITHLKEK